MEGKLEINEKKRSFRATDIMLLFFIPDGAIVVGYYFHTGCSVCISLHLSITCTSVCSSILKCSFCLISSISLIQLKFYMSIGFGKLMYGSESKGAHINTFNTVLVCLRCPV